MTNLSDTTVVTKAGVEIRCGSQLAVGAQGRAYAAAKQRPSRRIIAKQLIWETDSERGQATQRTEFLIRARLFRLSPLFAAAPSDWFELGDCIGHVSDIAAGTSLSTLLDSGWAPDFSSLLRAGQALADGLELLHQEGWAHGDLHPGNVYVEEYAGGNLHVTLIDYDNFWHASMPAPQNSLGQLWMLAPEQRLALVHRDMLRPDRATERFMLTVLLHWLLLLRHPAGAVANDPARFDAEMSSGNWMEDPARGGRRAEGGYPPDVLNAAIQNLIRRGFSLNRDDRPAPREWVAALAVAANRVWLCPRCAGPAVLDRSKSTCPFCRKRYPTLGIVRPGGAVIPIGGGGCRVGRDDLGGAPTISRHHANFERFGGEMRVVSFGDNGVFRRTAAGWERLIDGVPVTISPGDHLRFADAAEVTVRQLD